MSQYAGCGAIFCLPSGPRVVAREGEPIADYERIIVELT
jgi:hypothetical protein